MDLIKVQKDNNPVKLRRLFIRYLSVFCAVTLLLAVILISSFFVLLSNGVILPANYAENQLLSAKGAIAASTTLTPNLIPDLCRYAVYTTDGKIVSGNLSSGEAQKAWSLTQEGSSGQSLMNYYMKIARNDGFCIVRYNILAQFSSPALRASLPTPEFLVFLIFAFCFLLEIFVLASSFGKMLTRKMRGLQNATGKIQNQDLEFEVESSGVCEIDNVLFSIDKMKEALKTSLEKQWDLEQTRREQISALAHDVKTPLTVVRGNVELLAETYQTQEQKQYTNYIAESAHQMEQYIKALIEISNSEMRTVFCKEIIDSEKYIEEIRSRISALVSVKGLKVNFAIESLPPVFCADPELLQRAIMNVVSNAADYSPQQGEIGFSVEAADGHVRFCVTDSGTGFSPADLAQAAEQFYMGDLSRSSKAHYGMGLYITKAIVDQHNGTLTLSNSTVTGGGQVVIVIPVSRI